MYQNFIGIDISKNNFFVAIHENEHVYTFSNDSDGFKQFSKTLKNNLTDSLIILETTGGYEIALIDHLQLANVSIHRANTRKVKHFIRSYGKYAKTDSMDAKSLALYGFERYPKLELFKESPYKQLLKLVQRRNDLKHMLVQEKNHSQAPDQKIFKESFEKIIKVLVKEMGVIESKIEEFCQTFEHFNEIKIILKKIKGVGDITAIQLLAHMPELGTLNRNKSLVLQVLLLILIRVVKKLVTVQPKEGDLMLSLSYLWQH